MTMVAGERIVERLAEIGVRRFYTVPGESFLEILDAVERHPELQLISTRHESGAAFMAEADAKVTGSPAVAMATRGVGASNLAIGVHTAYQDSTPMVVLLGQVETPHLEREAFQEIDLGRFYDPITKWSVTAQRADRLPELVTRAVQVSRSGRPGPAMVAVPADLLGERVEEAQSDWPGGAPAATPAPAPEAVARLARLLVEARAPVVIAGGGCRNAREELIAVVERYGLGAYAAFRRQDVFLNDHPAYLGHLGLEATADVRAALDRADVVVAVGCRLSEITSDAYRQPAPEARVVQVDTCAEVIGRSRPVALGIVSDARLLLAALLELRSEPVQRDWSEAHAAFTAFRAIPPSRARTGLDCAEAVGALQDAYPDDPIVANDAGNFAAFLHRHWHYGAAGTQVAPTSGAMGYAVPAAIGAKLAAPQRPVLAVAGDGGFLMTGQEIETAVRLGLPVTVAVLRNGLYGTIAMHQARASGRLAAVDIGDVDIAEFARSLGATGYTAETVAELRDAVTAARADEGPAVLDIVIDPDVLSPSARLSAGSRVSSTPRVLACGRTPERPT